MSMHLLFYGEFEMVIYTFSVGCKHSLGKPQCWSHKNSGGNYMGIPGIHGSMQVKMFVK